MSEAIGNVDRRIIRRELNAEALFLAGFTEREIRDLGDLSDAGPDRVHELLWSRLGDALYRATVSHRPHVRTLRPVKRSRKARKPKKSSK